MTDRRMGGPTEKVTEVGAPPKNKFDQYFTHISDSSLLRS